VQGFTDFQKQQGDLMGKLESYMQPMKYDPNTDPSYLAYKQLASAQAKDASGAAMETLNSRGILNSSITRDDVAGIEQKYAAQAAAQIPILQQQAYNQNRDRVADVFKLLGNSQDQQQRGIENANSDRNFGISEGQLTGNYTSPNSAAVKERMAANSAAYASASPEEQMRLHEENIQLAKSIGGTDTTGSGDYQFTPQRTVQGQQLDNQVSETAYNHARDSLLDKRYEEKFNQDIKQQGFENALKIAVQEHQISNDNAQIAISAKNATTSAASAANSNTNAQARLAFDKEQAKNKPPSTQDNNQAIGKLTSDIDQMTPDNRTKFFKEQKSNIIAEHGLSGYNQLYNSYFDANGYPK
jgi:hypothetical protein